MLEIVGPQLVNMGELVTLVCRYDLGKDTVYSIKWYKDSHEIYRYVPTDQPEFFVFKTKGVNVDVRIIMNFHGLFSWFQSDANAVQSIFFKQASFMLNCMTQRIALKNS